jgi:hypothetical protein
MEDPGGGPTGGQNEPLFQGLKRRRESRRSVAPVVLGLLLLVAAGVGVWYWLSVRGGPTRVADVPAAEPVDTARMARGPSAPPLELPELNESDHFLRELLLGLSGHPRWTSWLVPDDLVRRFVTSVVNVAEGGSPRSHILFLGPGQSFSVRESGEGLVVDTASYHRYDLLTQAFVSLDTEAAAQFYRQLHPLFEEAHDELGLPDRTFDGSFALAVGNVLAVDVPEGTTAVVQNEAVYEYVDPRLESLSPAEKHVLRLGPENARLVQGKLADLTAALGITPGDPSASVR